MKDVKRVSLRLPSETMSEINKIADNEGETCSHVLRRAIKKYIVDYKYIVDLNHSYHYDNKGDLKGEDNL